MDRLCCLIGLKYTICRLGEKEKHSSGVGALIGRLVGIDQTALIPSLILERYVDW